MVRYQEVREFSEKRFCQLIGMEKAVFAKIVLVLELAHAEKKARGGRPNKLSLEDTLIMTLGYFRGYGTLSQTGANFGISESYACKLVHWTENILIESREFSLPGKKSLCESSITLINATETTICSGLTESSD